MKVITLTHFTSGQAFCLNVDHIVIFQRLSDSSTHIITVLGSEESLYVRESPEQIVVKLGVTAR